jgi:hypothetical protein
MIWSEWEPRKNSFGHSFVDTDIITIYGHDIPTRFGGIMRAMRKKESEISKEGALSILKRAEYGVLSTLGKDGVPYGVPMNFVFEGEEIFLHGAKEGHKFDNNFGNDNVCFTVVGSATLSRIGRPPPTSPSSFLVRLRSCPRRARRGYHVQVRQEVHARPVRGMMKGVDRAHPVVSAIRIKITGMTGKFRK